MHLDPRARRVPHRVGRPVVGQRPVLRDVKRLPYVGGGEAGLALGARF